ncbi:SMI1/KNR4 family protein [Amycolatopsis alba]|uniref:SMI1/KNR4 family protein n=1 Tax=Amycolatopsis alba TaxID=76020 RepID=UPI001427DA86|nr:SMI1/KNR4 family protein [Amycolatopsis alba]
MVERQLRTALPSDYKALLSIFPSGMYRDTVWVTNPTQGKDYWQKFQDYIRETLEAFADEDLEYLEGTAYRVFPEPNGLLPWGHDGAGGIFCWIARGDSPDDWPTAYYSPGDYEWTEHPGGAADLLADVLTSQGTDNILRWDLTDKPAIFRVHSIYTAEGWVPVE